MNKIIKANLKQVRTVAALGAVGLASQAFAFDTGLQAAETSVTAIIAIGVTIVVAIVTFTIGKRVAGRVSG